MVLFREFHIALRNPTDPNRPIRLERMLSHVSCRIMEFREVTGNIKQQQIRFYPHFFLH